MHAALHAARGCGIYSREPVGVGSCTLNEKIQVCQATERGPVAASDKAQHLPLSGQRRAMQEPPKEADCRVILRVPGGKAGTDDGANSSNKCLSRCQRGLEITILWQMTIVNINTWQWQRQSSTSLHTRPRSATCSPEHRSPGVVCRREAAAAMIMYDTRRACEQRRRSSIWTTSRHGSLAMHSQAGLALSNTSTSSSSSLKSCMEASERHTWNPHRSAST